MKDLICLAAAALVGAFHPLAEAGADDSQQLPPFSRVQAEAERFFSQLPNWKQGDLITSDQVAQLLAKLENLGWQDVKRKELTDQLVKPGEFLAQQLRSRPGQQFARKVSSEKLIYDRLDRIINMRGGQALVRDMIRLPDGHRYAQANTPRGVPSMEEFLPKGRSGKTPQVPNYDKPTKRIYTLAQLLQALKHMHAEDAARLTSPSRVSSTGTR